MNCLICGANSGGLMVASRVGKEYFESEGSLPRNLAKPERIVRIGVDFRVEMDGLPVNGDTIA